MRRLAEIGADHYTDKGFSHRYFEVYDTLLGRHRTTARALLEIGVYRGASMEVWREGFPNAELHGIDIKPVVCHGRLHVGNAYTETMLRDLPDRFDIIIDDGPHTLESMLFTVSRYTSLLAPGGTLIVEDVPNPAWLRRLAGALPERWRPYAFGVDRRILDGVPSDSLLFVVDAWT